jgi:hypothetical protein
MNIKYGIKKYRKGFVIIDTEDGQIVDNTIMPYEMAQKTIANLTDGSLREAHFIDYAYRINMNEQNGNSGSDRALLLRADRGLDRVEQERWRDGTLFKERD